MASFEVGFGTNTPNVQNVGVMDTTIRLIQTQPNTFARVTSIAPSAIQLAGAVVPTVYMPVFVLRGTNLGVTSIAGQLAVQLGSPLIPTDTNMLGFPARSQLTGNIELLFAQYVRLQNQGLPVDLDGYELYASAGQSLAVVMASLVDGSVAPPTVSTIQAANVLAVLGETGILQESDPTGFGAAARSLPRFSVPRPNGR